MAATLEDARAAIAACVCLEDYARLAASRLDANAWAYFAGGAADEITIGWNRRAFDRMALLPRVLRGAPEQPGHTRVTLLGRACAHPILLAPVAYQRLAHPDGEMATAYAAAAQDALMVTSSLASTRMEDIAQVGSAGHWFQLYAQPTRDQTLTLVRRAEAAGFEALVLTVDAPVNGVRNREHRASFSLPPNVRAVNIEAEAPRPPIALREGGSIVFDHYVAKAPTWRDVAWLAGVTQLPLLIKGILAADDAELAIASGAAGIIVSNHGGRTLDTAAASLDALPGVVARVGGRVPVLLDGGVQRGTDVVKALSLGAAAVLVGRPVVYGLAAGGAHGVSHVLRILRDEFEVAMALCGCSTLGDLGPHLLCGDGGNRN